MTLRVQLFGEFRVWRDQEELTSKLTHLGKPKTMLKILLTHPGRVLLHDELIEWLWPTIPPKTAAANLRKRISELRQALEPGLPRGSQSQYILTRPSGYAFNAQAPYTSDTQEFTRAWESGQKLERAGQLGPAIREYEMAAALFQDGYLAEDRYEAWAFEICREWLEMYLTLLERLAECEARLGHFPQAIEWLRQGLSKQPWRESFYGQWMLYAYLSGEQAQALKAYEECKRTLEEQLATRPSASVQQLHEQILKGHVKGVDHYRGPKRPRRRAPVSLGRLPFVGRDAEVARLVEQFEAACSGQGRAIFISGEAGVGKTRLIQELISSVRQGRPVRVLRGRSDELQRLSGFRPLIEAIEDELLLLEPTELQRIPTVCLSEVAELVPALRVRLRTLGLSVEPASEPGHTRRLQGLTQFFTELACDEHPLLLWLDDLHWADPSTLDFIEYFLPRLGTKPLLFLGSYRSEEMTENPRLTALLREGTRSATLTVLHVNRLPLAAFDALVEQLAPKLPKRELLSRHLHRRTGGNPFFLTAALQSFFEAGVIQQKGNSWWTEVEHFTANYRELFISPSVQELVLKRVGRLSETERELLTWASVLGQSFDAELLSAVAQGEQADLIESLTWAHLITEKISGPRPAYEFGHDLIREVVYEHIEADRRTRLHHQVAQVLESRMGDQAGQAAVIAQHFEHANELGKALDYMLKAHNYAMDNYRHHEAWALAERSLSLLERLRERGLTDASLQDKHWKILSAMDRTLYCLRERNRQIETLNQLVRMARQLGDPEKLWDALYRRSFVRQRLGRFRQALSDAKKSRQICERVNTLHNSRCWSLALLGNAHLALGDPERARALYEEALDLAQGSADHVFCVFDSLRGLCAVYQELGQLDRAMEYGKRALAIAPQLKDEGYISQGWERLGLVHQLLGQYERALECYERALEIALRIGNRPDILFLSRGLAHHGLGHYEQAKEFYEKEVASCRESGHLPEMAQALRALAEVQLNLAKPDQARAPVEQALKLARKMASPSLILACLTTKTRMHLHLNQAAEALNSSQEAVETLERGQLYSAPQEAYYAHTLALDANARPAEAKTLLEKAYQALMTRAQAISDADLRASFTGNIQANREIIEAWEQAQDPSASSNS